MIAKKRPGIGDEIRIPATVLSVSIAEDEVTYTVELPNGMTMEVFGHEVNTSDA